MKPQKQLIRKVVLLAGLFVTVFSLQAYALGAYVVVNYYSSAAKTTLIGTRTTDCDGRRTSTGVTVSPHQVWTIQYFCPGNE